MSARDSSQQLRIASPCTEDWDSMTGNDRVRFCAHCRLSVHNIEFASPKQIRRLIAQSDGRLCVTYREPLPQKHSLPAVPILHKIGRRTSAVAAGAFSATLGISTAVAATPNLTRTTLPTEVASATRLLNHFSSSGGGTVRGTVFDPNGAVIPNASVTLTNPQTEEQRRTTTAEDGQYTFTEVEPGDYHLKIEAPGFATAETRFIGVRAADDNRFDQTLTVAADTRLAGAVVVVMPSNPLVKAAADDDIDAVRAALASKVDPNVRDKDTQATALEYAVRNGNREILQVLLSAKAEVNTRDPQGQTPLMMVSEQVTSDLVWDLINAGAKVNLRDKEGDTALISAAEINNVDVLRTLLETGAKVNTANEEGQTALMIAAINGHVNNVRALLLAGANVNARDKDGNSALMHANANDEAAVARLLKAHGAVEFEVQQKQ